MLFRIGEVIVPKHKIMAKVREFGQQISADYEGKDLILVGVLKGGFVFMADLIREITIPCTVDFIAVSSYGTSTVSTGTVKITKDLDTDIEGKHVIIVEDLVDTGLTLDYLRTFFATRKPADIKACALLDKPAKRKVNIQADYTGIEIPDVFVVGYGLDYAGKYRNLPEIHTINTNLTQIKR